MDVCRNNFAVRDAQPRDVSDIGAAHAGAWSRAYSNLFDVEFLRSAVRERQERWTPSLLEELTSDGSRILVVMVGSRVVGFAHVGVTSDAPAVGELFGFYLHPEHWGTWAAVRLHEGALAVFAERGVQRARLWTHEGAERARRFYHRNGWTVSGATRSEDFGDGRASTLIEYRQDVAGT